MTVIGVEINGPADAVICSGDAITSVNGRPVAGTDPGTVQQQIEASGKVVELGISRGDQSAAARSYLSSADALGAMVRRAKRGRSNRGKAGMSFSEGAATAYLDTALGTSANFPQDGGVQLLDGHLGESLGDGYNHEDEDLSDFDEGPEMGSPGTSPTTSVRSRPGTVPSDPDSSASLTKALSTSLLPRMLSSEDESWLEDP